MLTSLKVYGAIGLVLVVILGVFYTYYRINEAVKFKLAQDIARLEIQMSALRETTKMLENTLETVREATTSLNEEVDAIRTEAEKDNQANNEIEIDEEAAKDAQATADKINSTINGLFNDLNVLSGGSVK